MTAVRAEDLRVGQRIHVGGDVAVVYDIASSIREPGKLCIAAGWDGRVFAFVRAPGELVELAPGPPGERGGLG